MYQELSRFILYIVIPILAVGCTQKRNANGSGYGGGDPVYTTLERSQQRLKEAALLLKDGKDLASLCAANGCSFRNDKAQCNLLDELTVAQRDFCAGFIQENIDYLAAFSARSSRDTFQVTDEPLVVSDVPGFSMTVAAKTALGGGSPVYVNHARALELTENQILALTVHEAGHQLLFRGSPVTDGEAIGGFSSGRQLLDVVGAAIAIYQNDHNSLPGSLDYRYFQTGMRIETIPNSSISRGSFGKKQSLYLVADATLIALGGVAEIQNKAGVLDVYASENSFQSTDVALEESAFQHQVIPSPVGGAYYLYLAPIEGGFSYVVSKMLEDRTLDTSFGDAGRKNISKEDLGLDASEFIEHAKADYAGRLLLEDCFLFTDDYHCELVRLNANGERDENFRQHLSEQISRFVGPPQAIVFQPQPDGSLSALFDSNGGAVIAKITEAGDIWGEPIVLQRHSSEASETSFSSLEKASNGSYVVTERNIDGNSAVVTGYSSSGVVKFSFSLGTDSAPFSWKRTLPQPDGKVLVVGCDGSTITIYRFLPLGGRDMLFGNQGVSQILLPDSANTFLDGVVDDKEGLFLSLSGPGSQSVSADSVSVFRVHLD